MMKRLTICVVVVAMLLCLGLATAEEESWYDRLDVSGYFQFRYLDHLGTEGADQADQFQFRRMFITLRAQMDHRSTGVICFSRVGPDDPNVDLFLAFVDYRLDDEWAIQAGQVPTWFGLEGWEPSAVRLPFERARILEAGPGFYWQGPADRGVYVRRSPQSPEEPLAIFGIVNGQFRSGDLDDDKNVELHLKWQQDWGQFGLSWMDGNYVDGAGISTSRNAVNAYVRKFADPWGFQAEWADGDLLGASRDGWYLQGVYDLEDDKNVLFARYEEFNARVDDDNCASFDAWTVGVRHRVYDSGYLTLQYSNGNWSRRGTVDGRSGSPSEDMLGIQWQYQFR